MSVTRDKSGEHWDVMILDHDTYPLLGFQSGDVPIGQVSKDWDESRPFTVIGRFRDREDAVKALSAHAEERGWDVERKIGIGMFRAQLFVSLAMDSEIVYAVQDLEP